CYHLYTYDSYKSFDVCARAEILCIQPSVAILKLKYLRVVDDVLQFDWLEAPSVKSLQDSIIRLRWLGALDLQTDNLTDLGQSMAILGLDPMLSTMILAGKTYNCLNYTIALAGMLTVAQNIWWCGKDDRLKKLRDEKQAVFISGSGVAGDFILLLRIYLTWYGLGDDKDLKNEWCRKYMINGKSLKLASNFIRETASQIHHKFQIISTELDDDLINRIKRCICDGFFENLAIAKGSTRGSYQLTNSILPTTGQLKRWSTVILDQQPAKFILYFEMLNLNDITLLCVACPIDLEWLSQPWLNSIPHIAQLCTLESYDFKYIGPSLMLSLVGKGRWKLPNLEQSLQVNFEANYRENILTMWGQPEKLATAKIQLQRIIDQESKKLHAEVQEYEIVGSTRILLGTGAEPKVVLINDEFVKVLLTNLPIGFTEEQIEHKCQSYGQVRHVTMIQSSTSDNAALATYFTCDDARRAVIQLSHEIWDGQEINVSPNYAHTSVYASMQNCKIKALWFMTESEGHGRVHFSQQQPAQKAYAWFKKELGFNCRIQLHTTKPTIQLSWPLSLQKCQALIQFRTAEEAQVVNIELGLFSEYSSFQRESVFVQPWAFNDQIEAYVQFSNEQEMQIAINEIDGKVATNNTDTMRLLTYRQQSTMLEDKKKEKEYTRDDFVIELFQLPSDMDEEVLIEKLYQKHLTDFMTNVIIFRKMLQPSDSSDNPNEAADENMINIVKLQSLFSSHTLFHSKPDIQIPPATHDGRVVASILFSDPHDVMTAMKMYKASNDPDLFRFSQFKIHFVPDIDHIIVLHMALVQAIPHIIEQAIKKIKDHPRLPDIRLVEELTCEDNQEIKRITIKGTNLEQILEARIIFDKLMKGVPFKFHSPSWVRLLFMY
ncbi:unnamed protein product, partial [Rotaria sp. Silwood2]